MSPEQEDALIDLLRQAKEGLDEHGVEFWLDFGTSLCRRVSETARISVSKALCDRGFEVWIAENHMNIKGKVAPP